MRIEDGAKHVINIHFIYIVAIWRTFTGVILTKEPRECTGKRASRNENNNEILQEKMHGKIFLNTSMLILLYTHPMCQQYGVNKDSSSKWHICKGKNAKKNVISTPPTKAKYFLIEQTHGGKKHLLCSHGEYNELPFSKNIQFIFSVIPIFIKEFYGVTFFLLDAKLNQMLFGEKISILFWNIVYCF